MSRGRKPARAQETPSPPAPPATSAISTVSAISWFTQATIILALIPFVGYWCCLAYELGVASYFGIPFYFISLTPTLVLSTSWLLPWIGLVPCVAILGGIILTSRLERVIKEHPKYAKYESYAAPLVFMIVTIMVFVSYPGYRDFKSLSYVGLFVAFILSLFLLYKNFENQTLRQLFVITLCTLSALVALNLGFNFFSEQGRERAGKYDSFPVLVSPYPTSTPEVAVIRTYGEYLYAVPFHRETRQFEDQLVIVKMSDVKTPLSFEKIGPLKPKE
jgi:hypothetical protein